MARTFEIADAVRERVPLLIGIMGPSGGGKTYSALRLAKGIQEFVGGEIYGIDTEARRMLAYADIFRFKHLDFKPPFGSLDYLEAIRFCAAEGAKTIIVDSITHEHIGQGGYLEGAEAAICRIARTDNPSYDQRKKLGMLGWAEVGPKRQRMIEGIKQIGANLIFCSRARDKSKPADRSAKSESDEKIIHLGMMPIAGDDLLYEMTVNMLLMPRADGVPTWRSDAVGERLMMKLPEQFRHIFTEGRALDEVAGRQMAEWAAGGAAQKRSTTHQPRRSFEDALRDEARKGTWSLEQARRKVTKPDQRARMDAIATELDVIAEAVDRADEQSREVAA